MTTDVAEALYRNGNLIELFAVLLENEFRGKNHAASRRRSAPLGSAQFHRFARYDARTGLAVEHIICIENPCHRLGVRIDVGRGNIRIGADDLRYRIGIAARKPAKFSFGKLGRIHPDAALCPAVGNIYDRAFQRHPGGESLHLVEADVLMKADASFVGTADIGMLHPPALEHLYRAVVHFHGQVHLHFALGIFENVEHSRINVPDCCRFVHYRLYVLERVVVSFHIRSSFEGLLLAAVPPPRPL